MLLAARLTWCITGTAEGTKGQGGGLWLGRWGLGGSLESLQAAAPKGGGERVDIVMSNAGWLESRHGEERRILGAEASCP